jgi:hypothetical protein
VPFYSYFAKLLPFDNKLPHFPKQAVPPLRYRVSNGRIQELPADKGCKKNAVLPSIAVVPH